MVHNPECSMPGNHWFVPIAIILSFWKCCIIGLCCQQRWMYFWSTIICLLISFSLDHFNFLLYLYIHLFKWKSLGWGSHHLERVFLPGSLLSSRASLVAQVKNLPALQEVACSVRDQGSIPGSGRSLGEGNGNPLQYPCLESSMDRGAWWLYSPWSCRVWPNLMTKPPPRPVAYKWFRRYS